VAFDARRGRFWSTVTDEDQRRWPEYVEQRTRERAALVETAQQPATTSDGRRIPVLANVASVADAESAYANGADGSGLVRTEVLFGDCETAPSVEEQTETFLAVADALGGRQLTIRTWDIGGDKPLPFLPMPREANPFLGVRGIRAFDPPIAESANRLLTDQLTAICRAAHRTPIRVMFPMVTTRHEVTDAMMALRSAARGEPPDGLEVGIMVEVPAAAVMIDRLAVGLDFVSIGTNDLTQYTVAADRGNDAVADLADPLSPAVLRLIHQVCRTRPDGVEVAVCGDLASRPEIAGLLIGLGVDELSCTPPKVPDVKAAVRRTSLADARRLAADVLDADEPAVIRERL
jgi:phosphocarrier protein FPr